MQGLFQIGAHHALHGMAVEADHLRQHLLGKQWCAAGFLIEDDLQQDAAGEVFLRLGVLHLEALAIQDQLLDVGQRDVGAGLRVVEATVGVFLDQPGRGGHRVLHCWMGCRR